MSTPLTIPWDPCDADGILSPCALYEVEVADGVKPTSRTQPGWTEKEVDLVLKNAPAGKPALWECLLAVWRFRLCEDEARKDELWQKHLSAWLVSSCRLPLIWPCANNTLLLQYRHLVIVRFLQIEPLQAIVNYQDDLLTSGCLPANMIPSLAPVEDVKLTIKIGRPGKQEQREVSSSSLNDVDMEERSDSDTVMETPTQQAKGGERAVEKAAPAMLEPRPGNFCKILRLRQRREGKPRTVLRLCWGLDRSGLSRNRRPLRPPP